MAQQVLANKLESLAETGADAVATANPGCVMQIGAGILASHKTLPVVHPVEFLDLSYRRAGYYEGGSDP
jgi:glycolate oxidase iron-sulfur subunit